MGRRLGLQIFEVAVDWTALQPKGRKFRPDPVEFDRHERAVDHLLEQEMEPQFSLHRGDLPLALGVDGGWTERDVAKRFVDYAEGISRRLGDRVERWLTFEDLTAIASGPRRQDHSEGEGGSPYLKACHHLLLAHGWCSQVIRENVRRPFLHLELNCPEPSAEADRNQSPSHYRWVLDPLAGQGYPEEALYDWRDQGAISTLQPHFIKGGDLEAVEAAGGDVRLRTDWPWDVERHGPFHEALSRVSNCSLWLRLHQPSESPSEQHPARDRWRVTSLVAQLEAVSEAMAKGLQCAGIHVGPLVDEEAWADGASPRQGVVWIDPDSKRRWPKTSGLMLQRLIVDGRFDGSGQ